MLDYPYSRHIGHQIGAWPRADFYLGNPDLDRHLGALLFDGPERLSWKGCDQVPAFTLRQENQKWTYHHITSGDVASIDSQAVRYTDGTVFRLRNIDGSAQYLSWDYSRPIAEFYRGEDLYLQLFNSVPRSSLPRGYRNLEGTVRTNIREIPVVISMLICFQTNEYASLPSND